MRSTEMLAHALMVQGSEGRDHISANGQAVLTDVGFFFLKKKENQMSVFPR